MIYRVHVVGVGAEGRPSLTARAAEIVDQADLLVGGKRLLALFPESRAERLVLGQGLDAVVAQVQACLGNRRAVVLASGDPGFFGIARSLLDRLGKERVEIIPNLSSVQLAFARIKESWEDATFVSVHGRPLGEIVDAVRRSPKAAVLTDGTNSPASIARSLLAAGVDGYRAYVCEKLGAPDERVLELDLASLAEFEASRLNVLILLREGDGSAWRSPTHAYVGRLRRPVDLGGHSVLSTQADAPEQCVGLRKESDADADPAAEGVEERWPRARGAWPHGIPEEEFHHRRGLITKAEVRLVSLARLGLHETSVVWDVGAGSGSVAVEAALIASRGRVYAVERSDENVELIRQNVAKFGTDNVVVVEGEAPTALEGLPAPDAVFIGGSGGKLSAILAVVASRLRSRGRVVANAATLETAGAALAGLRQMGFVTEAALVQVSRGKELAGLTHFEALDPVFIVAGQEMESSQTTGGQASVRHCPRALQREVR